MSCSWTLPEPKPKPKPPAVAEVVIPAPVSSPAISPTATVKKPEDAKPASPTSAGPPACAGHAPVLVRVPVPTVPAVSPKTGSEMLRSFNSMKRHPSVMAQYLRERVPPQLLASLFNRAPIEADDLGTLLGALKSNLGDAGAGFTCENGADYLRALLKTAGAATQLSMLSSTEQAIIEEVLSGLPAGTASTKALRQALRCALG
mmetsp:Transcript_108128/g.345345  ORF Transcript_108128/g.345345 Transcript_108128/m.345345 type:complete len:203 (+) Transcript_108128:2-610(+)